MMDDFWVWSTAPFLAAFDRLRDGHVINISVSGSLGCWVTMPRFKPLTALRQKVPRSYLSDDLTCHTVIAVNRRL